MSFQRSWASLGGRLLRRGLLPLALLSACAGAFAQFPPALPPAGFGAAPAAPALAPLGFPAPFPAPALQGPAAGAPGIPVAVPGNLFAHLGKNGPEGVFLETLDALLRGMGKAPKYVTMPTGDALADVGAGALAVATVVVPSARLASTMWLSEPVVTESNIVVALKDKGFALNALADLRGKRIGVRQGYRYPLLEDKAGMTLLRYSTDGEMLRSLLFGDTDVIVCSAVSDIFALRSEGIMKRLVILDKAVGTVPLVAAFSKKNFTEDDVKAFNRELADFKKGAAWKAIVERNGLSDLVQPWPTIAQ